MLILHRVCECSGCGMNACANFRLPGLADILTSKQFTLHRSYRYVHPMATTRRTQSVLFLVFRWQVRPHWGERRRQMSYLPLSHRRHLDPLVYVRILGSGLRRDSRVACDVRRRHYNLRSLHCQRKPNASRTNLLFCGLSDVCIRRKLDHLRLYVWNVCCVVYAATKCCFHKCYLVRFIMPTFPHHKQLTFTGFNGGYKRKRRYLRWYVSPGHNMSQADATSLEGEAPAITGCYKQYEHAITNKTPQSTDPNQVREITIHWVRPLFIKVSKLAVLSLWYLCQYLVLLQYALSR